MGDPGHRRGRLRGPRSFFGPPEAPADKRTLRALAKVEERSEEQKVDVRFKT
jgi:hypothetical protein